MVILDNHNSHAIWCCSLVDGNGWWSDAAGYNASNSRNFNTANWLKGLAAMANFSLAHPNVVGLSLRNEYVNFLLLSRLDCFIGTVSISKKGLC